MHIVIGVITAIAGLIWALYSLQKAGVDLNSFNPFAWARRRRWENKLGIKPIHSLKDTMEAAALLVVSVVTCEGEITRDTKMDLIKIFEDDFGISNGKANELFTSSAFMLKDVMNMQLEVKHVLAPTKDDFEQSHIIKLLEMMEKAGNLENEASSQQQLIIEAVEKEFDFKSEKPKNW
ncbi:MAG: phenylacetic acid degradation protein [Gammaproteobacteria bacterium]|nr:phenylacetic acid degradation protein [Gammaproteobacteria bacterium]